MLVLLNVLKKKETSNTKKVNTLTQYMIFGQNSKGLCCPGWDCIVPKCFVLWRVSNDWSDGQAATGGNTDPNRQQKK